MSVRDLLSHAEPHEIRAFSDLLNRSLRDARKKSAKAAEARAALPAGSSRARVTTANARWMRAAEHRDMLESRRVELDEMMKERGL